MGKSDLVGSNLAAENNNQFLNKIAPTARFHLMSSILNQTVNAICCFDKKSDYKLVYVNKTAEQLWGFSRKEVLGMHVDELSEKFFGEELGQALKECTMIICDFSRKSVETSFKESWCLRSQIDFIPDETGENRYLLCITRDITPTKRTEEDLERVNHQLNRTVRTAPGMIFELEMNTEEKFHFVSVSPQVEDIFGVTEKEAQEDSRTLFKIVHSEDVDGLYNFLRISASLQLPFKWEGRVYIKNGDIKWVLAKAMPERKSDGTVSWHGISIDITEQKNLEKRLEEERVKLIQSSQLRELGKLAGGIAHEINNPIFAIRLTAENLLKSLRDGELKPDYAKTACQTIISVSDRITQIVKGLRHISRDGSQDPMMLTSVKQIFADTLALCQQKFKVNGIDIKTPSVDEFLMIECRPVQIGQVLINLINNSFDAVKGKPDPWIEISVFEKLDNVVIYVTDCGPGIPAEIASKIMQPFYTTKSFDEGTGLGLSISESIVRNHRGQFWIDSECKNTRFCVSLPKTQT